MPECQYPIVKRGALGCMNKARWHDRYGWTFCDEHKTDGDVLLGSETPNYVSNQPALAIQMGKGINMDGLIEGRIVHYVLKDGEHRPAIIVKVWNINGTCNLTVFPDWQNDNVPEKMGSAKLEKMGQGTALRWATSILYSDEPKPGTWHWIERVSQPALAD